MTASRKYRTTTPEAVRDCLNAGMSIRRAAEVLGVSKHSLRQVCSLFGWRGHGWSGPKPNKIQLHDLKIRWIFDWGQR